jgi:excinuclease ABC subunit B
MAKNLDAPKRGGKSPKSKASRPDVQPIGPALADLLNPAINRGESGVGSSTGLQPPPDNSFDRRSGGEAAAHRARASTRGKSEEVGKRDASGVEEGSTTEQEGQDRAWEELKKQAQGFDEAPQTNYGTSATINWDCRPPRTTTRRWRVRRAARWRRSASRRPRMRWRR